MKNYFASLLFDNTQRT